MSEVERIVDQFQRAFDGHAWHGPSVLSILEGITAEQAAAHPLPGTHSIWELTFTYRSLGKCMRTKIGRRSGTTQ